MGEGGGEEYEGGELQEEDLAEEQRAHRRAVQMVRQEVHNAIAWRGMCSV